MKSFSQRISEQLQKRGLYYGFTGVLLFMSFSTFAQSVTGSSPENSYWMFSNMMFNVLLGIIIFLLIAIAVLAGVLKGVGEITLSSVKNNNKLQTVLLFLALSSTTHEAIAQGATSAHVSYGGLPAGLFYLMLMVIVFELIILLVLIGSIKLLIKKESDDVVFEDEVSFFEKINASVAIEKESDIMMDHEYDGIRELDNDLPPWWKYGFYISIAAAFVYLIHYHVFKTGDLQEAEYNKSLLAAKLAKEEYERNNANKVDENTVTMVEDAAELDKGKAVYIDMCAACHGKVGQGGVGPNLADDYWLHGGSLKEIFKSIKYGWPDKGMKAWDSDLSPVQIRQITSYIRTLRGTNPPDAKEPQGELYVEEIIVQADSLQATDAAVK